MSYKDTRQELQKGPYWQSQFNQISQNTLWRFRQRRTATKAIVSSPTKPPTPLPPLTKDGAKFPREK